MSILLFRYITSSDEPLARASDTAGYRADRIHTSSSKTEIHLHRHWGTRFANLDFTYSIRSASLGSRSKRILPRPIHNQASVRPYALGNNSLRVPWFQSRKRKEHPNFNRRLGCPCASDIAAPANPASVLADIFGVANLGTRSV